jgi:hypothetical protein
MIAGSRGAKAAFAARFFMEFTKTPMIVVSNYSARSKMFRYSFAKADRFAARGNRRASLPSQDCHGIAAMRIKQRKP